MITLAIVNLRPGPPLLLLQLLETRTDAFNPLVQRLLGLRHRHLLSCQWATLKPLNTRSYHGVPLASRDAKVIKSLSKVSRFGVTTYMN